MKKQFLIIVFLFVGSINTWVISAEVDQKRTADHASSRGSSTGCLICHRFPGLVSMQENGKKTELHIDEKKYFSSLHGKLGCRDCHEKRDSCSIRRKSSDISHKYRVDCQKQCHTGLHQKTLSPKQLRLRIHQGQQSSVVSLHDQTSCTLCHTLYPHSKKSFTRAFLNMHASYIYCEVCHLDKKKHTPISYRWVTTKHVEFSGEPFGSFYEPKKIAKRAAKYSLSRIAPMKIENNKRLVLVNTWDIPKVRDFLDKNMPLDAEKKTMMLKYLHKNVSKMKLATACEECHSAHGLIRFRQLGFSKRRSNELININIKGIVSKYREFHLPAIFE